MDGARNAFVGIAAAERGQVLNAPRGEVMSCRTTERDVRRGGGGLVL